MKRARLPLALLLLIFAGALALRLPNLGNRPMHADEAVHAEKFRELWLEGRYRYDPNEFHGPTLYYAALPIVKAGGRHGFGDLRESDLRLATAIAGGAIVLLLALLADGIGWAAVLTAALLLATSTAFVFYSRYFIQEILLAFFTLGAIAFGWRTARSGKWGWSAATGLFAGLAIATKETAALSLLAAFIALPIVHYRRSPLATRRFLLISGYCSLITIAAASLLLSTFLTNLRGPLDYLRSFTPWIGRAHGTDLHRHPWSYYLEILGWHHGPNGPVWSEGLILALFLMGVATAIFPNRFRVATHQRLLIRFFAVYTVALTAIYTAIPYKTPWNVLSFLLGMAILAGVGIASLIRIAPGRPVKGVLGLLFLAGAGQLAWQAYRGSFVDYTISSNPYVYAQTVPDAVRQAEQIEEIARANGKPVAVEVIASDGYYWPLPWYLRRLPQVGFWTELPSEPPLPIVIASSDLDDKLAARLQPTHVMTGFFGLRPGVLYETWVKLDVWERYLKTRKRSDD